MALPDLPPKLPPFRPLPPSLNIIPFVFEGQWTLLEQIAHLRAYIKWLIECMQEFEKWAGETSTDLESIHTTINQIITNLTEINNKITELENNVGNYDNRITELENSVKQINISITNVNNEIENIKNSIDEFNTNLNNVNIEITDIKNSITELNTNLNNINSEINNIKTSITDLISRIESIETEQIEQNNEIEHLKNLINTLTGDGEGSINQDILNALVNYVKKIGDIMSGNLTLDVNGVVSPNIIFKTSNGRFSIGMIGNYLGISYFQNGSTTSYPTMTVTPLSAKSAFEISQTDLSIGRTGNSLSDVVTKKLTFDDGTFMTTAPLGGSISVDFVSLATNLSLRIYSIGQNILFVNLISSGSISFANGSVYTASVEKEFSNYKSEKIWNYGVRQDGSTQTVINFLESNITISSSGEGTSNIILRFISNSIDGSPTGSYSFSNTSTTL